MWGDRKGEPSFQIHFKSAQNRSPVESTVGYLVAFAAPTAIDNISSSLFSPAVAIAAIIINIAHIATNREPHFTYIHLAFSCSANGVVVLAILFAVCLNTMRERWRTVDISPRSYILLYDGQLQLKLKLFPLGRFLHVTLVSSFGVRFAIHPFAVRLSFLVQRNGAKLYSMVVGVTTTAVAAAAAKAASAICAKLRYYVSV